MHRTAIVVGVALLLVVPFLPAGTAGWRANFYEHNEEPNVGNAADGSWDFDASKMFQDGNAQTRDRIYFDFFNTHEDSNAYVPMVHLEGNAHREYFIVDNWAFLGFWRDCNGDNFIGSATTGDVQYTHAQGVEEGAENGVTPSSICPASSLYQDDVNFVEFLSIGPGARDMGNGADDQTLCPSANDGPSGNPDETRRAETDQGILDGGDNVFCGTSTYRFDYIQDDFAKVWTDIGLPTDSAKPTGLIFPLTDGNTRDTNGHFRYVDGFVLGQVEKNSAGLWPAESDPNKDPAGGQQCNDSDGEHDGTGYGAEDDGLNAQSHADNAQASLDSFDGSSFACSPIPNVGYFGFPAPIGDVGWPGHTAEDRLNSSEKTTERSDPYTAPFDEPGPHGSDADDDGYQEAEDCEFKGTAIDTWDDDHSDGDPLYGYDFNGAPTDFSAYYGPADGGPSYDATVGNIVSPIAFEVEKAAGSDPLYGQSGCNQDDSWFGGIEAHAGGGQGAGKSQVSTTLGFDVPIMFNPSHAPGGPAPDTTMCAYDEWWLNQDDHPLRCGGAWEGASWIDVPNEAPDEYWIRTIRWTAYADVSFGDTKGFDTAGDGPFTADPDGVFDATGLNFDIATALPAGEDDAHQYGDEQCDDVIALDSGTDSFASGTPGTIVPSTWSCDRNVWEATHQKDCSTPRDELSCYMLPYVGDPYDLRDVECWDNDFQDMSTTDENGPLGDVGQHPNENLDCDTL